MSLPKICATCIYFEHYGCYLTGASAFDDSTCNRWIQNTIETKEEILNILEYHLRSSIDSVVSSTNAIEILKTHKE